jgi:hypothetical protein
MAYIVSTRFTQSTLKENRDYREKTPEFQCIYGSPQEFSPKILYDLLVFVVEMNNDTNCIEGIGLIRNHPFMDKYYKIHDDANYNRYVYKSNYFVDRDLLLRHNEQIVKALDHILFKEKTHLKRGSGFTRIPEKLLKHHCITINLVQEIKNIFVEVFDKKMVIIEEKKDLETIKSI